jgi:hypothetical protein
MDARCPECGGSSGKTCAELFHDLLAQEAESQELQGLHFFNVGTFNMQHPSPYDPKAHAILKEAWIEAFDRGWDPEVIRRELKRRLGDYDGAQKIVRPEAERTVVPRTWTMTIHDVVVQGDPSATAARVKEWAKAVRAEL